MTNRTILESHPISTLRKEISKTNIKGYSKMKKAAVVELMLKKENASKFSHIKMREKAGAKPKEIIIIPKRKIKAERAKKISAPKREAQKAKVIAPKKRVASIPKVVKGKPKETAGQKLTGLTKEQMNKLSPLELFGKLPVALAVKGVLNPKSTGVKVGKVLLTFKQAEKMTSFDFNDDMIMEYQDGVSDNISYNGDYEAVPGFSSAQANRYRNLLAADDLTEKQSRQREQLDEKFLEGIGSLVYKREQKAEKVFRKENKGKKTLKEWHKLWDKFEESVDLDDYV